MQGLTKPPARIKKFVPHSPIPRSPIPGTVADSTKLSATPVQGCGSTPTLKPERFDRLAHDARNVFGALKLYCELLAEPGVLTVGNRHYAQELKAIRDTASRLVERLSAPRRAGLRSDKARASRQTSKQKHGNTAGTIPTEPWPSDGVDDLGRELLEMRPLLAGIAGPRVQLEIATMPCGGRSRLSTEDFTRVMMNLVRNASEAMSGSGRLRITAQYGNGLSFLEPELIPDGCPRTVTVTVEDSGPGVPEEMLKRIFLPGFTTRRTAAIWPEQSHRGLGLTIVRGLAEAAGGTARACPASGRGARFEVELPVTSGMYEIANATRLVADAAGGACIECP